MRRFRSWLTSLFRLPSRKPTRQPAPDYDTFDMELEAELLDMELNNLAPPPRKVAKKTPALKVGDKAPALPVAKWLVGKGCDPSWPNGSFVTVVELWATWCSACRTSIPHMNKLHARFSDKNVLVVAITAENEKVVTDFLATTPFQCSVGLDTNNTIMNSWKSKTEGIPHAFVVDRTGVIVWSGHPMDRLDRVLEKVINNTYDSSLPEKLARAEAEVEAAVQKANLKAVEDAIDKLIGLEPDKPEYHMMKLGLLAEGQPPASPERVSAIFQKWVTACREYPDGLRLLAETMRTQKYAFRDPDMMLSCAKALELAGKTEPDFTAAAATIYADLNMFHKAIDLITKALAQSDGQTKDDLTAQFDYYTKVERLQSS